MAKLKLFVAEAICGAVFLAASTFGQAEVPVPGWLSPSPAPGGYVPAEYTGNSANVLKMQFPNLLTNVELGLDITTKSVPSSGVIALIDRRATAPVGKGWDTGKERVYYLQRVSNFSAFPAKYHCILWNSALSRSEIVEISITANFTISQSAAIAVGNANGIWGACGIIGGELYVYDIGAHSIRRYLDLDQNSVFETLDANFNLAIPHVDNFDGSFESKVAGNLSRLNSFEMPTTTGSLLKLRMSRKDASYDVFEHAGVASLATQPGATNPRPVLRVLGNLVVGQERLLVAGTAGTSFKIFQVDSAGQDREISNTWTINEAGEIRVDLKSALLANSMIWAQTDVGSHKSALRKPLGTMASSLLPPKAFRVCEGVEYTFFGDRLKSNQTAYCLLENGTEIALTTTWVGSSRRIKITMPDLGTAGIQAPLNKLSTVWIGMKKASSLENKSQKVKLYLRHN